MFLPAWLLAMTFCQWQQEKYKNVVKSICYKNNQIFEK
jgi:hypothetical protein